MSGEHIARLQKIGFAPEVTAGTAVSPTFYMPKGKGVLVPKTTYKYDQAAYGNRDKNREAYITSKWSELTITDTEPRDVWMGHFLKALFGLEYPCVKFPIGGSITGTYSEGEVITESTTVAKGTLRRLDAGGSSKALYVEPTIVGTATITIASPGVVSLTGHGFSAGDGVSFTTTALPTGLSANTNYYVIAAGLTANAFEVSATSGGSAINTTGSQSGTHTVTRGYFAGGLTLTGGTSGATATGGTIEAPSAVRHHVFRRLNTNNPPSYTISANDPVSGDEKATYCVLDTMDMECMTNDIIKFAMKFLGQPMVSSATLTPTYTTENPFLGKQISFKTAATFNSLDAASVVAIEKIKVSGNNNVEMIQQSGGSDPLAPTSLHSGEFEFKGDFSGLFNATTIRGYALAGTGQALRLAIVNTTTIGSAANPTLQFDFPEVYYSDWGKDDANDKIVRQNVAFTAVYNNSRGLTVEALLVNTQSAAY